MSVGQSAYRRNQVEWALWRIFCAGRFAHADAPPAFRTRIKRLLEIDRAGDMPGSSSTASPFAFADDAPGGSGVEAAFTAFDVFCLALALDLLDMGFKQAEVVFLLRHIRHALREEFDFIADHYPPANRQRHRATDYPDLPTMRGRGGALLVDERVYLLLRKVELREALPTPTQAGVAPIIAEPVMCAGQTALAETLADGSVLGRKAVVLEIGESARLAPSLLAKAPAATRGGRS